MNIQITKSAFSELSNRSNTFLDNYLSLKYDIDGCGCVVSGVIHLVEVELTEIEESLVLAKSNLPNVKVVYERQYEWVYDDDMLIDYESKVNSFILKSSNQIFNPRMKFIQEG
ncbi:iron-sulfur cluster biosynthesis family protein [Evansella sp. AB-P1]|uniref:iron-sulfur cluster biosynthesis family protein n=1 Tax=Evansella sp. AB-P1 TaxID=3037653 RepID=UPI00241C47A3|nr:iron-sulfur cluster biosynthesis family protein [Evansella sp. AB-P1]MDG5788757.1 iron-sulfur cluster biosynthesis family protein [Evansella sp. AB-P1]